MKKIKQRSTLYALCQPFKIETVRNRPRRDDIKPLIIPSYKLKRFNYRGIRLYYYIHKGQMSRLFGSGTSVTSTQIPISDGLLKAYSSRGYYGMKAHMNDRSVYGSFTHDVIASASLGVMAAQKAAISGKAVEYSLSSEEVEEQMISYAEHKGKPSGWVEENIDEVQADITSWMKFFVDFNLEPFLVEQALFSQKMGIATQLDFYGAADIPVKREVEKSAYSTREYVCCRRGKIKVQKGDPYWKIETVTERMFGLIDYKSGKKGFYPQHEAQLHIQKKIFEENFPDLPVQFLISFRPNEWTGGEPTYTWKEQSGSDERYKIDSYIHNFNVDWGNVGEMTYKNDIVHFSFNGSELDVDVELPTLREYLLEKERGGQAVDYVEESELFEPVNEMS